MQYEQLNYLNIFCARQHHSTPVDDEGRIALQSMNFYNMQRCVIPQVLHLLKLMLYMDQVNELYNKMCGSLKPKKVQQFSTTSPSNKITSFHGWIKLGHYLLQLHFGMRLMT